MTVTAERTDRSSRSGGQSRLQDGSGPSLAAALEGSREIPQASSQVAPEASVEVDATSPATLAAASAPDWAKRCP